MRERIPQRHRLYLAQTSDHKLSQPAPARDGVDTLGGRRALGVDVLGLGTAHALAPAANGRSIPERATCGSRLGSFGLGTGAYTVVPRPSACSMS